MADANEREPTLRDVVDRLDRIDRRLDRMDGRLDCLTHRINDVENRVLDLRSDIEEKFGLLPAKEAAG